MSPRTSISRLRRPLAVTLVAAGVAAGGPATALAQDSLPDPNQPKSSQQGPTKTAQNSDLPSTGIETSWLVLAGVALLAGGLAVRPAVRMRRRYRTDTWEHVVRSGS